MNYKDKFEINGRSKITIYNMDCMEFLEHTEHKYDLAIVDPPYGIGADIMQNKSGMARLKADGKSKAGRGWKIYKNTNWDSNTPNEEYWKVLKEKSINQIVWGGNYFINNLTPSMGWIVWDKGQRNFSLADGELAWTSFNIALRIFDCTRGKALAINKETGGRIHPTQKPVKLYEWLLNNYAKEGQTILDTHLGSGSIAIACWNLGFDLTACELDEDYYKDACERLSNHTKQGQLF